MGTENKSILVLFADISGSTRLYDTLGNEVAKAVVSRCMSLLKEVTVHHQGRCIKTIGDEIMCVFADVASGTIAAGEMHMAVQKGFREPESPVDSLHIRIGMHFGEVILEQGDAFGDAVNVASRIVDLAKADQILTSRQTVEMLPQELCTTSRFLETVTLKGKVESFDVYELIWDVSDVTMMLTIPPKLKPQTHSQLIIRFAEQEYIYGADMFTISLGRSEQNDIRVANALASRQHAIIEFERGRFVLVDQSVNGTYVYPENGEMVLLKQDRLKLDGSGWLSLGQLLEEAAALAVYYACK